MLRWLVIAMAANAQQCDELPYEVATYAFTIRARDGHAIDARVYAPSHHEAGLVRDASGAILSEGATVKVIKDTIRVDRPEAEGGLPRARGRRLGDRARTSLLAVMVTTKFMSPWCLKNSAIVSGDHGQHLALAFAGVVYAHGALRGRRLRVLRGVGPAVRAAGSMLIRRFAKAPQIRTRGALRDLGDVAAWANDKFNDLIWGVAGSSSGGYMALAASGPVSLGQRDGVFIYVGTVSCRGSAR